MARRRTSNSLDAEGTEERRKGRDGIRGRTWALFALGKQGEGFAQLLGASPKL